MGRKDRQILILLLCSWLAACVKDKPADNTPQQHTNGHVYIVCEGNFGNGDATLYTYNTTIDSAYGDIYKAVNAVPLGDIFQSMRQMGDSLYLCINNSDKIVVINASDKKNVGTIGIPKPRYILPVGPDRAYVSTLYSNKVYVIDPHTLQITGTVELPCKNTEGMCLYDGSVLICPWDTACNNIYETDAANGNIKRAIQTGGYAPHAVLVDKEQTLWVMSGNIPKGRPAVLSRIDPSTGAILKKYDFPPGADPIKPVFNTTKDTLYFIEVKYDGSSNYNGIYRMSIHDAALPAEPFIRAAQFQYFWALGIDPATGYIYAGDPKGFIQKGTTSIYKPNGTLVRTFDVGLGPGQYYFGN